MACSAVGEVVAAATALSRAGNWSASERLLGATHAESPAERAALALAVAEIAVEADASRGSDSAPAAMRAADQAVKAMDDPELRWDFMFLRIRREYLTQVFQAGELQLGQEGRSSADVAALGTRIEQLGDDAPDGRRAGSAAFYRGLIADNLEGERAAAPAWYERALASATETGDELLASSALRHLGDHAEEAGDLARARELWERSAELRAREGFVPGVLAQQMLLAVLSRAEGDETTARAIAREVVRWAGALQIGWLRNEAAALLADPA
jgi:hypothetical protein